ncbi:hypothetical protein GCM10022243_11170 [Saccharothrix violaceirubra]|uniref:Putative serine protease PepD n=1 Tax=Saccharothrix violaceirubra TaxID=413306 RepID=A0A7W7T8P1_9PSEU|nr:trypsin-like peptidase domain-containing protein [Saccharothrix violaceirubra]MBB4968619.1 putative serine protease PepD [Saccharothrix violaceirubra]
MTENEPQRPESNPSSDGSDPGRDRPEWTDRNSGADAVQGGVAPAAGATVPRDPGSRDVVQGDAAGPDRSAAPGAWQGAPARPAENSSSGRSPAASGSGVAAPGSTRPADFSTQEVESGPTATHGLPGASTGSTVGGGSATGHPAADAFGGEGSSSGGSPEAEGASPGVGHPSGGSFASGSSAGGVDRGPSVGTGHPSGPGGDQGAAGGPYGNADGQAATTAFGTYGQAAPHGAAASPWERPSTDSGAWAQQGFPRHPYQGVPGQPQSFGAPVPRAPRSRGRVAAGVAALVLVVGGLAGGIGGYVGYQAANDRTSAVSNALDAAPPVRQSGNTAEGTIESVARKVLPTVVQVQLSGGTGSGFVISSDGLVLTNNHVVESAASGGAIKVQFQDGKIADARIVGRDPSSDLAVIKVQGVSGLPTAELGSSGDLKVGQQVVAVGSPFDLAGTVTSGIVSSLDRPVRAGGEQGSQATVLNAVQTDAAINPGNSGGPLVDMNGRVIGINSAIYSPNSSQTSQGGSVGIGFAIPIDQARRTAKELSETGKATQTVLGVQVTDVQEGGAQVREVSGGGAAEQAGVKAGDVITKFGDRPIDTSDALVAAVRSRAPGDKVKLTIGDKTVEVTLGSQPVETR